MEKWRKSSFHARNIFIITCFLLFLPSIHPAWGQEDRNGREHERKITILPAGAVVNHDYFASGEIVEISGTVNGDVYAAGGQVTVDGKINGDLIAVGGTINVSGVISQDARMAGGNILVSGEVGRNVSAATANLSIAEQARIHGGLVAAAGSVNLTGPIGGDTALAAGNISISDSITGNVKAAAGRLRVTSRGNVEGDLTYWSDHPALIEGGAKIGGKIIPKKPIEFARPPAKELRAAVIFLAFLAKIISFISTLILGLLFIVLFPKYNQETILTLKQNPGVSLGIGFVLFFMVPITALILLISIFGIPLAFLLAAAYMIFLYLARIPLILWAGIFLFERFGWTISNLWAFFSGLLIYFFLSFIPFVGVLVTFSVLLFGAGAASLTVRRLYSVSKGSGEGQEPVG